VQLELDVDSDGMSVVPVNQDDQEQGKKTRWRWKRQGASSGPVADGCTLDHPAFRRTMARSSLIARNCVLFTTDPPCDNVGNTMLSCFPQSNTTLVQDIWSKVRFPFPDLPVFYKCGKKG
jgi:hypothetical protein